MVKPCELLYSTLRPTSAFVTRVHSYIKGPYMLMTDTADEAIANRGQMIDLLRSQKLRHWWAVDNEVARPSRRLTAVGRGHHHLARLGLLLAALCQHAPTEPHRCHRRTSPVDV